MSEEKSKIKDSNELLNIILILLGLFFIFLAIMDFLAWAGIALPGWVSDITSSETAGAVSSLLGSSGLISIALGFWAIVSGIGMFREEEWAMGQALVVLSIMVVVAVSDLLGFIAAPEWWLNWINYVSIIALVIGVVGFFWLLATRKRYD